MSEGKYISIMTIPDLDDLSVSEAKRRFRNQKENGVIINGTFEDSCWLTTDEYAQIEFNFNTEKKTGELLSRLNLSYDDMILYMKSFIVFKLGEVALVSLQAMIRQLKYILLSDSDDVAAIADQHNFSRFPLCMEFISLLPVDVDAKAGLVEEMEDVYSDMITKSSQRQLGSFDSYFKFNEILNDFWHESQDISERLFYFPVYLWWHLSAIIPMRPREFVLTPRDCLKEKKKKWYLTIRKDTLKGRNKKKSYKIATDYSLHTFEITPALAKEIKWYIEATEEFDDNTLNTLFIADTHYAKWDRCRPYTSRYFTYINLSTCLRYFFEQIVQDRYHYTIIYDRESTYQNEKEINYIYLGDTRHLALINLILEGATPVVAMALAGQDDEMVSAGYYSNITKLIECKVYRQFQKAIKGKEQYAISRTDLSTFASGHYVTLDSGGRCYSEKAMSGDYSDCNKTFGSAGEIGFCADCYYFRKTDTTFDDQKQVYQDQIFQECQNLAKVVEAVRREKGNPEDIIQVLLNLKNKEFTYQHYLEEMEVAAHGATKENYN